MDYKLTFSGRFHYRCGGGVSFHQHRDDYQIQLVYGGSANIRINSEIIHVTSGDVVFLKRGSYHEFFVDSKNGMRTLEVKFRTEDSELIALLDKISTCIRDEGERLFGIFSQIVMEGYRQVFPYKAMSNALLLECIALMVRISQSEKISSLDATSPSTSDRSKQSQLVADVTEYISLNIGKHITINDIAKGCGYSSDYLYRVIKRETGRTAVQFVNNLKFKQAKRMIQHTELSLSEIAWDLGFSSLQYFSRFFRQHAGVSPSEYMTKVRSLIRTDY